MQKNAIPATTDLTYMYIPQYNSVPSWICSFL